MSDQPAVTAPKPRPNNLSSASQLLIDLGPIAVFVLSYNLLDRFPATKAEAIFYATGIFMVSVIAAAIYCQLKRGRIPPVLLVTGILVTVFGGLTLILHNETFIKIKPTVYYAFCATAITVSVFMKRNVWKLFFRHIFTLPDRIWDILALRWAAWFAMLAVLNEIVRTYYADWWVNSRLFLFTPLVVLFAIANTPLVLKHQPEEPENAPSET